MRNKKQEISHAPGNLLFFIPAAWNASCRCLLSCLFGLSEERIKRLKRAGA